MEVRRLILRHRNRLYYDDNHNALSHAQNLASTCDAPELSFLIKYLVHVTNVKNR